MKMEKGRTGVGKIDKLTQRNVVSTESLASYPTSQQRFLLAFVIGLLAAMSLFVVATFAAATEAEIELSSEESAWLKAHPVILHAPDPDYAPFEFKDKTNHYNGIAPDFLKLVNKKLGVEFKAVPSASWAASLENVKRHKADLVTVATETPERSEYMLFTSPYIEFKNVILVRGDVSGSFTLENLAGKTIAAIKGWAITTYIKKQHPEIKLHWVKNVKAALYAVSDGNVDAVLLNRATAGYWRSKTDVINLRIAGETAYTYKLSFASRKDWPQLNILLDKALNTISKSERKEIIDKWIFPFQRGWRPGPEFWIGLTGIVVLLLIIGIFVWILTLRRQVRARTIDLQTELDERKRAERALREERKRAQKYLDIAGVIFVAINAQEKVSLVNQKGCEILGYEKEEIIGKNWFDNFLPKRMRDEVKSVFQKLIAGEAEPIEYFENPTLAKSGEERIIAWHNTILRDEVGDTIGTLSSGEDITDRKQAEEAIKESEERYRTILESIEEGYYEVDIDGNFTFVNDSQCKILGYSRDEIIGINYHKYMDKKDTTKVYQGFNRVYKTGVPSKVLDWELIRKDGTKRFVEISASLIKDSEGNPSGFRGISRDVTERKLMGQSLQSEREKFASLAENAPFGMSIINATGRYEYINHKFTEIFGYTLEDIPTGKLWFKGAYPDPEYRKEVISIWINDLSGAKHGELRPREFKVSCKDGSQKDIYFRSVMLRNGNQIVTYEAITEKKLLEAQLLQAQKMEAIGTLAGGIAHNFNNLLMSIQGNTSLMLLDTNPNHPHYERLTNIEKSVQSGSKLTSQLLGYARGGRYEVKPISINRIITDTSSTFSMTRKDITLHQDLANNLSGVKADLGQIEQVVLNIYVNAAEAMVGGGELFITTKDITHKDIKGKSYTINSGNYILLTIRDTGIGMDKDTQAKVFDPFFTTKGLAKGTGLGLASVYGIMKAHGGYIDVESQKGHGTTFFLYLPASKETIGEEVKTPGTIEKGKETILLVDDEEIILDVGEALLTSLGYTVLIAHGGKEAIEIVRTTLPSFPPDLVILDMIMPQMGGGETYDRMKEVHPTIKVLLSSGYSIDGQAKEILKRGCNGFIQKPFTLGELSKAIREVVEG